MDLNVALAHVDGDRQFLAELASMFLQDYPRLLQEARDSILQGDHKTLERTAHTLKGRLAFFGVQKGREKVIALELLGRSNDLSNAAQMLAEVEAEMAGILVEFEALLQDPNA